MASEKGEHQAAWAENGGGKEVDAGSENQTVERGAWGNQLEFILTCVGYAVGLGNVWRFPYLCFLHGGGAFLIPYVLMLILIGLPIFYFELSFGQFASMGPISIWRVSPTFKGVGFSMVMTSCIIGTYYNVVIAYSFFYIFASFTSELPWTYCDPSWATSACITSEELLQGRDNETFLNNSLAIRNLTSRDQFKSPTEEYFYNHVIQISDGLDNMGPVVWQLALCLLLSWLCIFMATIKGVASLGKVIYFVSLFPYLMITVMIIRGCTLPGASKGIEYYMNPVMSRLSNAEVWSDAATQIFYSLSACSGGLIAMASFNNFNNNILRDSILVPVINCCTSVYAGFAIFSVLGFMADQKGVDVKDVATQGPGLMFIVYPEALAQMPIPPLWSILFFLMVLTLGFSSMFSMAESVFAAVMDEFPGFLRKNKTRPIIFRLSFCVIVYILTLPMITHGGFHLFDLTDSYTSGFPLLIIGLVELVAINWVYGYDRFAEDYSMMLGKKPLIFFRVGWAVISPLALLVIIISKAVQYEDTFSPDWANSLGWLIVFGIVGWIPIVAIVEWLIHGGWEVIKQMSKPTPEWGPANPQNRTGRYAPSQAELKESTPTFQISPPGYETHTNKAFEM